MKAWGSIANTWSTCLVITAVLFCSVAFSNPLIVKVNFTEFPPYFEKTDNQLSGMAVDMLDAMNKFQSKYQFTLIDNPPMRRFYSFEKGGYDISLFDHLHWGWDDYYVQATDVYLRGGEKYVALARPGRGQDYFENFKGKRLGGFLGYHYGLANYNSDPKVLKDEFNMELSSTHEGNVLKILEGRIDVAILTDAFLSRWFLLHPEKKDQLIISDIWDQQYNFSMIVRKDISPSAQELNSLMASMEKMGALDLVWKKYGISTSSHGL